MVKLVRDKIPDLIIREKREPIFYVADEKEYYIELVKKLQEEVDEFTKTHTVEELVDILEVIYAIIEHNKLTPQQLESIRSKKAMERGQFKNKYILKEIK